MNKTKPPKSENFELAHFRFHRDEQEQLVFIPSGPDLEGYLAFDLEENRFVQARLLKTQDTAKLRDYKAHWGRLAETNESTICPEILAYGEEESVPYCISSLPAGEPVSYFVKRGGPVPPEIAANLVLKFIRSLCAQGPINYQQFEISPATLWITRSPNEPRIMVGDISPIANASAEQVNAKMCTDLFKYLSGNPPFNAGFQNFISHIEAGQPSIGYLANKLEDYVANNPQSAFWTDYNQPNPILQQLVPPEAVMQSGKAGQKKNSRKAPLLKYAAGICVAGVAIGLIGTLVTWLIENNNEPKIAQNQTNNEAALLERFPKPMGTEDEQPTQVEMAAITPRKTQDKLEKPLPPLPAKDSPMVKQSGIQPQMGIGDGVYEDLGALISRQRTGSVKSREIFIDPALKEAPVLPNMPAKASFEDRLNQIASEAKKARDNNRIVEAVEKEVTYLSLSPKSVEPKVRLNGDLLELQQAAGAYTSSEIETIKKAASFNLKAYDVLVNYYRAKEDWTQEIETLVKYGKSGRPDKLTEAGERIFQNPLATEGDRKSAREYFVTAAQVGDAGGQFFAGECMVLGRGGDKNLAQGTYYLRKAIEQGDGRAMDLLGVCYIRAWGVRRNDAKAVDLFQKAIDKGNVPAYYNLGARYAQGQGVVRDATRAAEIFGKGSAKGNAHCMLVYARCFEAGYGLEQSDEKATYWFSKSAERGNAEAITWCERNNVDYLGVLADSSSANP